MIAARWIVWILEGVDSEATTRRRRRRRLAPRLRRLIQLRPAARQPSREPNARRQDPPPSKPIISSHFVHLVLPARVADAPSTRIGPFLPPAATPPRSPLVLWPRSPGIDACAPSPLVVRSGSFPPLSALVPRLSTLGSHPPPIHQGASTRNLSLVSSDSPDGLADNPLSFLTSISPLFARPLSGELRLLSCLATSAGPSADFFLRNAFLAWCLGRKNLGD